METTTIQEILQKYPKRIVSVPVKDLVPNPWNPNRQQPVIYESLKKSILKYGWLQAPIVRDYVGQYQIIDGEHRSRAAKELKMEQVEVLILGSEEQGVTDSDAKVLTQLLNTRGQDDVLRRAELLKSIKESNQQDLFGLLPMKAKEIEAQLELLNFDFSKFESAASEKDIAEGAKALKLVYDLEKELRKLHANSDSTSFRLLLEQYFEWAKVIKANLELT